jgi:hypothetical protein
MARSDYRPDHRSTGRYLRSDPSLGRALQQAAQLGADYARSIAPRDSGDYAASIRVEDGPTVGGTGRFAARQSVNLVATDPAAAAVEWGRGGRAGGRGGHRVLGRAVDVIENG